MRGLRYVLCDVFTNRPLTGNALAVFTDARGVPDETMGALARELNLSEATFITPAESGGTARVRIFTPRQEIPFAGHPILGSAAVLAAPLERESIVLETGIGHVEVVLRRPATGSVEAAFSRPVPDQAGEIDEALLARALRLPAPAVSLDVYDVGLRHLVVVVANAEELRSLQPDLAELARLACDTIEVCVAQGETVELRVFAPKHGVAEDPATGSAVGPVLWHLHRHGTVAMGATVVVRQGDHLGRPSRLIGRLHQRGVRPEVEVAGAVVTVARGEFRVEGLTGRAH